MPLARWETRVKAKKQRLADSIPQEWKLDHIPSARQCPSVIDWVRLHLTDEEILITETPPSTILANIHARIWTAEDVVRAFSHRAAIAHQLTTCLTEVLFEQAIATARELDKHYQMTGTLRGPLHGLPMSFMDRYRIAGSETAAGFVSWLGPRESIDSECVLVKHMRQLGAIPFCKTNMPQSMMLGATENNIHGSTTNPFARSLSAGGAAGGEGALQAMRGSPFGWATEIAGSARIPATLNGLYSLRACAGRLSTLGLASCDNVSPICSATPAMMSWDLEILDLVSRMTLGSKVYQEDPQWLDIPWRDARLKTFDRARPVFAVMKHDRLVQPHPPIQRALRLVREGLQAHGYEVVEWDPPPHAPAVDTLFRILGADGASGIRVEIEKSGEPPVKQLRTWYFDTNPKDSLPTASFWSLCRARMDYNRTYQSYWKNTEKTTTSQRPVDGVVLPVIADVACYENGLTHFGYSAIINHLDFAAVSFPVTSVDCSVDVKPKSCNFFSPEDEAMQSKYDPETFHGLPVGLQVMCGRLEEEVALRLAAIITRICRLEQP